MVDYTALKNAWTATPSPAAGVTGASIIVAGMTTDQKLAAINAWTVAGPNGNVSVESVVAYLGLNGKLSTLQNYAATAVVGTNGATTESVMSAKELAALINCPNAPSFEMSSDSVYSTVEGMLNALEGDANSGILAADVTALLVLAATTIPWWQANGYTSPFNAADLALAGGLI